MRHITPIHLTRILLAGAVLLLAAGCGSHQKEASLDATVAAPGAGGRLVAVDGRSAVQMDPQGLKLAGISTIPVRWQELRGSVQATGQVSASDSDAVQVTARLPGKILQALVSVGSTVRPGQLIATVDSVDLAQAEATYRTALAHFNLTNDQYVQQKKLANYGAFSEQPVEDARRAYSAAQSAVSSDRAQLAIDRTALANTRKLVAMGEITHKPVEDAQNAYAQTQSALIQAHATFNSAKANLDRAKILLKGGVYAQQQMEDAQAAYDSAAAAVQQDVTQEALSKQELDRQQNIYRQNLNGASSIQQASGKLQQDQHAYQNDLTSLAVARTELNRAQVVYRSKIPTTQALQQAKDAYDEANVGLEGAANTLKLYGVQPGAGAAQLGNGDVAIPVVSPIAGVVVSRNMAVGQMADTSTPLVKVLNLDSVYVDAQVYENDLGSVAPGDAVQVSVPAFPGRAFDGRVSYVGHEVSADTRTVLVRTVIANPGWRLRPGMAANVTVHSRTGARRIAVPSDAILQDGDQQVVFVQVGPGEFQKRQVRTGTAVGSRVPVYQGLNPGDHVVVGGNALLQAEQDRLETEKEKAA